MTRDVKLSDVTQSKLKCEAKIRTALYDFVSETGLWPEGVEVEQYDTRRQAVGADATIEGYFNVELEVRL